AKGRWPLADDGRRRHRPRAQRRAQRGDEADDRRDAVALLRRQAARERRSGAGEGTGTARQGMVEMAARPEPAQADRAAQGRAEGARRLQMKPRSSSQRSIRPADVRASQSVVVIVMSGETGGSYGSSMPVIPLISPRRAFSWRCLTS